VDGEASQQEPDFGDLDGRQHRSQHKRRMT
jgi:hypothetical protein